jgi:hypothetical protein
VRDVAPVEGDRSGGGLEQPGEQPPGGRLAAARLAHQRQRLAAQHLEVQPIDGLHGPGLALQQASPDREVLSQFGDL